MTTSEHGTPTISIVIPAYEMRGKGAMYLKESLDILLGQSFKDFEVVVSDQSRDDTIESVCVAYKDKLSMVYTRCPGQVRGMAPNTNNGIRHANGSIIKFLMQDDFLEGTDALERIANAFADKSCGWVAAVYTHTTDRNSYFRQLTPRYDDVHILFKNSIGSPSVVAVRAGKDMPLFDENLSWYVDLDYYKRCFMAYGMPTIINTLGAINRLGEHQVTNTLATEGLREKEFAYILKKHAIPQAWKHMLLYRVARYKKALGAPIKHMVKSILKR